MILFEFKIARLHSETVLYAAITILVLITLTFFLMRLLPGDPFYRRQGGASKRWMRCTKNMG